MVYNNILSKKERLGQFDVVKLVINRENVSKDISNVEDYKNKKHVELYEYQKFKNNDKEIDISVIND